MLNFLEYITEQAHSPLKDPPRQYVHNAEACGISSRTPTFSLSSSFAQSTFGRQHTFSLLSMDTPISESPWTINSSMSVSVAKPVRQSEYFRSPRYSICAELPPFSAPPQQCYTTHELYNLLAATLPLHVSADNPLFLNLATNPLKRRNSGLHS
jgi:hypothetical protein